MSFHFIQRLRAEVPGNGFRRRLGDEVLDKLLMFGASIEFDYMEKAEFEGLAVPNAARRLVAVANDLRVVTQNLVQGDQAVEPVHFICTREQEGTVLPEWHQWSQYWRDHQYERPETSTYTGYFQSSYADYQLVSHPEELVGWWAITPDGHEPQADLIWTRNEIVAEGICRALRTTAAYL